MQSIRSSIMRACHSSESTLAGRAANYVVLQPHAQLATCSGLELEVHSSCWHNRDKPTSTKHVHGLQYAKTAAQIVGPECVLMPH